MTSVSTEVLRTVIKRCALPVKSQLTIDSITTNHPLLNHWLVAGVIYGIVFTHQNKLVWVTQRGKQQITDFIVRHHFAPLNLSFLEGPYFNPVLTMVISRLILLVLHITVGPRRGALLIVMSWNQHFSVIHFL